MSAISLGVGDGSGSGERGSLGCTNVDAEAEEALEGTRGRIEAVNYAAKDAGGEIKSRRKRGRRSRGGVGDKRGVTREEKRSATGGYEHGATEGVKILEPGEAVTVAVTTKRRSLAKKDISAYGSAGGAGR